MKKGLILIAFGISLILCGCNKEKILTPMVENPDTAQDTLIGQGTFVANAHPTSGTVKLTSKSGKQTLSFEDFKTDKGPDLRVYVSKTTDTSDFIEAGNLKSLSGNFNYVLNTPVDIKQYKYVLIWCEDAAVLFGNAELK